MKVQETVIETGCALHGRIGFEICIQRVANRQLPFAVGKVQVTYQFRGVVRMLMFGLDVVRHLHQHPRWIELRHIFRYRSQRGSGIKRMSESDKVDRTVALKYCCTAARMLAETILQNALDGDALPRHRQRLLVADQADSR